MFYWRERHLEVDFVVETARKTWVVEVKSGRSQTAKGMNKFMKLYPESTPLLIGTWSFEPEVFFNRQPVTEW